MKQNETKSWFCNFKNFKILKFDCTISRYADQEIGFEDTTHLVKDI